MDHGAAAYGGAKSNQGGIETGSLGAVFRVSLRAKSNQGGMKPFVNVAELALRGVVGVQ